jgi:hypothetical protein
LILLLAAQWCAAQAIGSVFLVCVAKNPSGGANTLTWDAVPNNPCGPFVNYEVYKSPSPLGPYTPDTIITDQSATSFTDFNTAASTNWYYYITDSFACTGATYMTSDTVENANPDSCTLINVTVNPDSSITFNWVPSASQQTTYYIVYNVTPSGATSALATVIGRFNTTYTDRINNSYASSAAYAVAAYDSCGQRSEFNFISQQTIFLSYTPAHCDPAIPLAWTKGTMTSGVYEYEVFVSRNDSAYALVTTLDSTNLNYNYESFNDGDSLQIHIVAINDDSSVTSSSEYIRFIGKVIKPPAYIYITQLSVDTSSNAVDLTWVVDSNTKIMEYETYNSQDGVNYTTIPNASQGIQQVPVPVSHFFSNADSTVTPQYYPYFYEVQAYDSCLTSTISPPGEIVSLQGTLSDYYQITLTWNKFELYGANVIRYDLYRDVGTGMGMQFDHSFDSSTTTYIDSVFQFLDDPGQFCYVIVATYALNLPIAGYSATLTSLSNIACVDHRPIIYIPNAFVYNGVNNFFKPRIIFGDPAGYDMTIWDRYGGKIFETHDPNGSWDGTNDGHVVEQGGYPYLIQFTALDGTPIERKGIVLFIRK